MTAVTMSNTIPAPIGVTDPNPAALAALEGYFEGLAARVEAAKAEGGSVQDLLTKLALSGADAKTLMLAQQILDCDQMITDNLREIEDLNKLRAANMERKQELAAFKAFVSKYGGDDHKIGERELREHWAEFVKDNPTLAQKYGLVPMPAEWVHGKRPEVPAPQHGGWADGMNNMLARSTAMIAQALYDEKVRADPSCSANISPNAYMDTIASGLLSKDSFTSVEGSVVKSTDGSLFSSHVITTEEVEAAMLKFDDATQKIDQAKELINIRNQQALQRKQRTFTLVSNFNQADHEGRKAVINNTRA